MKSVTREGRQGTDGQGHRQCWGGGSLLEGHPEPFSSVPLGSHDGFIVSQTRVSSMSHEDVLALPFGFLLGTRGSVQVKSTARDHCDTLLGSWGTG